MTRLLTALLLATLVAGCGFYLRGQVPIAGPLRVVHIDGPNINGPLTRAIRQQLEASDVRVVATAGAQYTLWIAPQREQQRTVSYSGQAKSAEIQITTAATFSIRDRSGQTVFGPRRVSTERVLQDDINNVNATVNEAAEITRELQQQLAQLIVLQYSALKPADFATTEDTVPKQPAAAP